MNTGWSRPRDTENRAREITAEHSVQCAWLVSKREVAFEEGTRAEHLDAAETRYTKQVLVSTDNGAGTARDGARQELVVIRIGADRSLERHRWECVRVHEHEVERHRKIDPGELVLEFCRNTTVLFVYIRGEHEFESAVAPRRQNLMRRTGEQNARHEDIRVQNDLHRVPRIFRTARAISDTCNPASRACRRAFAAIAANSCL